MQLRKISLAPLAGAAPGCSLCISVMGPVLYSGQGEWLLWSINQLEAGGQGDSCILGGCRLVPGCSPPCNSTPSFSLQPAFKGLTFTDLPLCLQLNIMQRLSDGRDLVSLGQVAPDLHVLSEDRLLWKKLCQYHFSERQVGMAQRSFLPSLPLCLPPCQASLASFSNPPWGAP